MRTWLKKIAAAMGTFALAGVTADSSHPLAGGCFADEYHWRDGIGPKNQHPIKVNTHCGGVEENNEFGTHEFFDLVEILGTDVQTLPGLNFPASRSG